MNNIIKGDYEKVEEFIERQGSDYMVGLLNYVDDRGQLEPEVANQFLEEYGQDIETYEAETKDTELNTINLIKWLGY
tara:strand:+ start:93 stop:323 length:231 start_codon:yes stop_codon:yes gene_type:complete